MGSKHQPTGKSELLADIYRKLCASLEELQTARERYLQPADVVAGIVLEDDLIALIEECESFFVADKKVRENEFRSFELRGLTVLEEAKTLLAHETLMSHALPRKSQPAIFSQFL